MSANAAIANLSKADPMKLAVGAGLLIVVLYMLARKTLSDAAGAAGGIISGNNAATSGTDYEGKGLGGTLGAVTNAATGGALGAVGGWIAGLLSSDDAGESLYYTVTFPDGARHAIPSLSVAANGTFTYAGKKYLLGHTGTTRVARPA